eukprot:3310880-Pyramimonas_sp.AAC.1
MKSVYCEAYETSEEDQKRYKDRGIAYEFQEKEKEVENREQGGQPGRLSGLSLIHISEPTRPEPI